MNWYMVLKVAGPVLNIVSSLVSAYVTKHDMRSMIKEEVARVMKEG